MDITKIRKCVLILRNKSGPKIRNVLLMQESW